MKNKNLMGGILAIAVLLVVGLGCNALGGHGTKLTFNGGELYYTGNVTEDEANRLGNYLVQQKFFDGKEKSVQLDKQNNIYQFRMVVLPGKENEEQTLMLAKVFAKQLSTDVFNNAPTEMHLCDNQLKTLKVVTP